MKKYGILAKIAFFVCLLWSCAVPVSPPDRPNDLKATVISESQINLAWSEVSDNMGVRAYKIYRQTVFHQEVVLATGYSDTGLSPSTRYCYTLVAVDAAGNVSAESPNVCATTNVTATGIHSPSTPKKLEIMINEGVNRGNVFGTVKPEVESDVLNCGNGGQVCSSNYPTETEVTLTAEPALGFRFESWAKGCSGTNKMTTVVMTEDKTCTAIFIPVVLFTVNKKGAGLVTSDPIGMNCETTCSTYFDLGKEVKLTATPATGFVFSEWSSPSGASDCTGTTTPLTITLDTSKNCTAIFKPLLTVAKSGEGSISSVPAGIDCGTACSAGFDLGGEVKLTVTPVTGFVFSEWSSSSGAPECTGATRPLTIKMDAGKRCTAIFKPQLKVGITGKGSITSAPAGISCGAVCSVSFDLEAKLTLTAAAAPGFRFVQWVGDCSGTTPVTTVIMTSGKTCTANVIQQILLTVEKTGEGSVTSSPAGIDCGTACSARFDLQDKVMLTATPTSKTQFSGWSGGCSGTPSSCVVTLSEDKTVTATFSLLPPPPQKKLTVAINTGTTETGKGGVTSTAASAGTPSHISCTNEGSPCEASYPEGTAVSLTATAEPGSHFYKWTGGCSGTASPCVITLDTDQTVTAIFSPSPPLGIKATFKSNGTITVEWDVVSGATGYNLYEATASGVTRTSYPQLPGGTKRTSVPLPFVKSGLANGATYYFVVTAVGPWGESGESAEVSAMVPAVTGMAAGDFHSCALLSTGKTRCWGKNVDGQLGDGTIAPSTQSRPVSGISSALAIAGGAAHTCALITGSTVQCWGSNSLGQLGNSTVNATTTPIAVLGAGSSTAIATGNYYTCALISDRTIQCWGDNSSGQLGNGETVNSRTPVLVSNISTAIGVVAGDNHACALLNDGSIQCWGQNDAGQLGNGTLEDATIPVPVTSLSGSAIGLTAGVGYACALIKGGTIQCWGQNDAGQLGVDLSTTESSTPVSVNGITSALVLDAGDSHTCTMVSGGAVKCWGANGFGQLGNGEIADSFEPVLVNGIAAPAGITAGGNHTCIYLSTGTAHCWGKNSMGQLGDGTTTDSSVPKTVTGLPY
jgi:alpha-tubulin suppressor-like RCC1 family protein